MLLAAAVYNVVWGIFVVLFPSVPFDWIGVEPPKVLHGQHEESCRGGWADDRHERFNLVGAICNAAAGRLVS
jgi:hypothetical protein